MISPISKTAHTKHGNEYKQSNAAKTAGLIGLGAYGYKAAKSAYSTPANIKQTVKTQMNTLKRFKFDTAFTRREINQLLHKAVIPTKAATIAIFAGIGLAIGAVADFAINSVRSHKADKKA